MKMLQTEPQGSGVEIKTQVYCDICFTEEKYGKGEKRERNLQKK